MSGSAWDFAVPLTFLSEGKVFVYVCVHSCVSVCVCVCVCVCEREREREREREITCFTPRQPVRLN